MATLFDTLRQNMTGAQPQQTAGVIAPKVGSTDNTSAMQRFSSAATGKVQMPGTGTTPRLSNLAEQVATSEANSQAEQLANQGQIAGEALKTEEAAQNQSEDIQQSQLNEQDIGQQENYNMQASNIIRDIENKGKQLDVKKDAAKLEQLGTTMRLSDDKYVTQLQAEGRRARLDNQTNFEEALTKSVFEDEQDLFNSNLDFRGLMKSKGRDFEKELGDIDLNFAIQMANANKTAANQRLLWGSVGTLVSAGIQAGSMAASAPSAAAAKPSAGMPAADAPITSAPQGSYWGNPGSGVA